MQLIELIYHRLIEVNQGGKSTNHKLVVTAWESSPTEIHRGLQRRRDDLKTTHKEADVIMIQQVTTFVKYRVETPTSFVMVHMYLSCLCITSLNVNFNAV